MQECCPMVAAMDSSDILAWFNTEVWTSELAHAFPATADESGHFTDVTLAGLVKYGWFLNEWQGEIVGQGSSQTSKATQNSAAYNFFGLPSFPDTGFTWENAADRMIYVAHNFYQADTGSSPNFGDVSAIFSTSYVKDMVMIAPIDTGRWHMSGCDPADPVLTGHHNENCSTWDGIVGTLQYHNHMILPNFAHNAQNGVTVFDKAASFFKRSTLNGGYETLPNLVDNDYWESNIAGNPRLPDGVKFLIGNFPVMFGTSKGRELQQTCDHFGWPLVWAFGYGDSSGGHHSGSVSVAGNKRIIDPTNIHTNASLSLSAFSDFEQVWSLAESAWNLGTPSAEQWSQWWTSLEESQVRVAPMSYSACEDSDCIGTSIADKDCICKASAVLWA